ncbi:hypothetical protein RV00_GL002309 [Enterococcus devriesei]|uniref:Uncharacterized protein n=1 Tax=Enterococcus devriesei TaxID=319970 RepID=A0A1L8SVW7_9ENTE|nr:hypothetical protein RV00_GL002309 [Enterococcus devriesei]
MGTKLAAEFFYFWQPMILIVIIAITLQKELNLFALQKKPIMEKLPYLKICMEIYGI